MTRHEPRLEPPGWEDPVPGDWDPDWRSECCDAPPLTEVCWEDDDRHESFGACRRCRENTVFYDDTIRRRMEERAESLTDGPDPDDARDRYLDRRAERRAGK